MCVTLFARRSDVGDEAPAVLPEPPAAEDIRLTDVLQAMSDPSRLTILRVIADGAWHSCGTETWGLELQKSTLSHHYKILRQAGLIEFRMRGRNKDTRLRRSVIESRFPGLLDGVLTAATAEEIAR
jgi:DNA-binding transcriptional ArsR family regulator